MIQNLVIVESPAKAKTIEKYLGSKYRVVSSKGHVRDLPSKGMNIDIENGFIPKYEVNSDKKKLVSELKKMAAESQQILLASDEDREGEAISWHLSEVLKLDPKSTKRIVFHEITKQAIEEAVKNPRSIDINLVNAQQARRILDRVVGYELSPVLWKKIKVGLSAGRVQSVAVRLVVEKERSINDYKSKTTYPINIDLDTLTGVLRASYKIEVKDIEVARDLLQKLSKNMNAEVANVESKPASKHPGVPFTTSSLQQAASNTLGYSPSNTMRLAQKLYESGLITYMRTDSLNLSNQALAAMDALIKKEYGPEYHQFRVFKSKSKGAQEAHEAIRPTNFNVRGLDSSLKNDPSSGSLEKLYKLIWSRTVSTQMAPARTNRTILTLKTDIGDFKAEGEVLVFDGFLKVASKQKEDVILPDLKVGQKLDIITAISKETLSKPPARYSEASLIKDLEELGIGRPSTYAPTLATIDKRGYVEKTIVEGKSVDLITLTLEKVNNVATLKENTDLEKWGGSTAARLAPTEIGTWVNDFLVENFKHVVDFGFTADMEERFDEIAIGKRNWQEELEKFYKNFHPEVTLAENIERKAVSKMRLIGVDPKDNEEIYARFGKYGPMLQKGRGDNKEDKVTFAAMPDGEKVESVSLEKALKMFELPRILGKNGDDEIRVNIGMFGPYIQIGKKFVSINKDELWNIDENEAIKRYKEKFLHTIIGPKIGRKKLPESIEIIKGPYGSYLQYLKQKAKLAEDIDYLNLSFDQAKEIIETEAKKPKKSFRRRAPKRK